MSSLNKTKKKFKYYLNFGGNDEINKLISNFENLYYLKKNNNNSENNNNLKKFIMNLNLQNFNIINDYYNKKLISTTQQKQKIKIDDREIGVQTDIQIDKTKDIEITNIIYTTQKKQSNILSNVNNKENEESLNFNEIAIFTLFSSIIGLSTYIIIK